MSHRADARSLFRRRFVATQPPETAFDDTLRILEHCLSRSQNGTIVHLMSGFGHLSVRMAKRWGARIVAVEPDDRLRAEAARRNGYSSVIYMSAAATRLPVQNNEADAVVVVWGGRRFTDLPQVAEECRRILRPQGRTAFVESVTSAGSCCPPWSELPDLPLLSSTFFDDVIMSFVKQGFAVVASRAETVRIAASESELRQREEQLKEVGLSPRDSSREIDQLSDKYLIEQVQAVSLEKDG